MLKNKQTYPFATVSEAAFRPIGGSMGVMDFLSTPETRVFPSQAEANRCGSDDFLESRLAECQWMKEQGLGLERQLASTPSN